MKNKKILIILLLVVIVILIVTFFYLNTYKKSKIVNNIDKSNIKEYILKISSYQANVVVTVHGNKSTNKYILKQQYADGIYKQEVIEPGNISGLITIYDGKNLKIENTNINLIKVYEDYKYIAENTLDLYTFLESYNKLEEKSYEETENEIIMKLKNENSIYGRFQNLYIDKNTALPIKMEIIDKNQNTTVYIEYNEISFNSINKEEILAFSLEETRKDL